MSEPTAAATLANWLAGTTATQVMGVVTSMNLADAIGENETHVDDIAKRCDVPPERMIRLLRVLTSMGLCTQSSPHTFALTEMGALLRKDQPGSLYNLVRLATDPLTLRAMSDLEFSVRTGEAAFRRAAGMSVFEYFANEPELSAMYNALMSQRSREAAELLPEHYDFSGVSTVTDVGGGDGTLLTAVLKRNPHLSGTVFDTEDGRAQAEETVRTAELSARCTVTAGSFFDEVPAGADVYLLKSVLHDWDDDHAVTILARCRAAMTARSRLLIIETMLPDIATPGIAQDAHFSDMDMLVFHGGKERTQGDFTRLCASAGLTLGTVTALPSQLGHYVLESVPAE